MLRTVLLVGVSWAIIGSAHADTERVSLKGKSAEVIRSELRIAARRVCNTPENEFDKVERQCREVTYEVSLAKAEQAVPEVFASKGVTHEQVAEAP